MKRIPFVLLALLLSGVACSDDSEGPKKEGESDPVTLTLSDPNATEETKALYSNLWAIQSKGFMFGHHDDLMYGRTWYGTEGGSDTKAVCGDYPAVYSFDFAEHIDDRHASDPDAQALRLRCCREAYDRIGGAFDAVVNGRLTTAAWCSRRAFTSTIRLPAAIRGTTPAIGWPQRF